MREPRYHIGVDHGSKPAKAVLVEWAPPADGSVRIIRSEPVEPTWPGSVIDVYDEATDSWHTVPSGERRPYIRATCTSTRAYDYDWGEAIRINRHTLQEPT